MKQKYRWIMRLVIASILCTVIMLFQAGFVCSATDSEKTVRLAVLPLDVARTGPYSYLGNSIGQMLTTRLSSLEKIDVIGSKASETTLENIRIALKTGNFHSVARELDADWVADGSIYSLKNGIKMNLTLYPGAEGTDPALFGITAEKPEDILPAITGLTADIGRVLTGAGEKQEGVEAEPTKDDGMAAFKTPHPELAYKKGIYSGGGLSSDQDERFSTSRILRSSSIPVATESMALADLDGDGSDDLIVASRREIRIFRYGDYRFDQIAAYTFKINTKINALTVLPGTQNAHAKLLVSADGEKMPASAVLSWNGSNTLQLEQDNIEWYIRAVAVPGEGGFIAGQRLASYSKTWKLAPGVFRLALDEHTGRLIEGTRLALPEKTRLFDFVYADLDNDNVVETIVIDSREKLLVYNGNNELLWVSSASYGGGLRFYGQPLSEVQQADEMTDERLLEYIPGRLEVKDIDHNGTPEIIVNTNSVSTLIKYFPHLKSFDGGSVACLVWSDGGLKELWRTNKIDGYVADYAFETENTATPSESITGRLYVAQTQGKSLLQKFLPGGETTKILMYEMNISPPKNK